MSPARLSDLIILTGIVIVIFTTFHFISNNNEPNPIGSDSKISPVINTQTTVPISSTKVKSHLKKILEKAEESYQKYVNTRKHIVNSSPELINPWPKVGTTYVIYFYEYFLPVFSCPHTTQRIGRIGDGGKFVCGFELFEMSQENYFEDCVLYSFGINRESSFEAEFLYRTYCEIYAFDASVKKMGPEVKDNKYNPRVHFSQLFIGDKNSQSAKTKTLGTIMRENGHKWIDVLKMDIERNEFSVLNQILDEFEDVGLPFGQLQLEIHASDTGVGSFADLYKLWERLEDAGLRPFMNEVNHYPCVVKKSKPRLMEYSFINIKVDNRLLH